MAFAKVSKGLSKVGALIGGHPFVLEVANTPETLQKGLMGRSSLEPNAGMLFQFFDAPQFRYFWMKGCLIPLDILFVNDRRIVHIEHLAQPCLPEVSRLNACPVITTRHTVDTVIEIAGGRARKIGLQSGDVLQWLAPSGQLPSSSR
ncbi:MAG: DUF192 domain-containing protein [Vampirovibrionales bacterium]|nr:DUF192 domain-containing protein [Vampirovibrionales bacterium]